MSQNLLIYDACSYKKQLEQSTKPLAYQINSLKYENCSKCRHELGLMQGTAVSHIQGNLVDLETALRGQGRVYSQCPESKYKPACLSECNKTPNVTVTGENGKTRTVNTQFSHLPPCQMIRYDPVPLPPPLKFQTCS